MNLLIPMAGAGSRFRDAGYALPKPLIDVRGKPMIARVIENLHIPGANLILIARKQDAQTHGPAFAALEAQYRCRFLLIDRPTEGAACTILHAEPLINNDTPLLIANSDQLVDHAMNAFIVDAQARRLDGSILTFDEPAKHPKWSYAALDADSLVTRTKEKDPISTHATVGIYYFARGRDCVSAIHAMIAAEDRCNNEFYLCPCYNYMITQGQRIGIQQITRAQMHGLGTPEDLALYLKTAA